MVAMTRRTTGSRLAKFARWRGWIQAAFLLAWLNPWLVRIHSVCSPVFHCYSCPLATFACPIGVMANFSALHLVPWIAIGTVLATGALFGSLICGWVCPFGFLQDLLGRIPVPTFRLPSWLGYTRYAVLVVFVLAVPYFFTEHSPLFFCRLCPAGAAEAALPNMARQASAGQGLIWPSTVKLTVLGLFFAAALFTWRPWCTLFCPLGAIYGLCNRASLLFVRFREEQCNDCEVCESRCRYRGAGQRRAGETRCVRCLECFGCGALGVGTVLDRSGEPEEPPAGKPLVTIGAPENQEISSSSES
jgi:polyferredoxin